MNDQAIFAWSFLVGKIFKYNFIGIFLLKFIVVNYKLYLTDQV
jgi:hypothetical protein